MSTGYASLKVEMAFGANALSTPLSWTDVSANVKDCSITRGRNSAQDSFPAATCTFTLDNRSFTYDPDNPFGVTIAPSTPVRISCRDSTNAIQYLFQGYVNIRQGWTNDYSNFPNATTTVSCSDFLAFLATYKLPATVDTITWTSQALSLATQLGKLGVTTTVSQPVQSFPSLRSGDLLLALIGNATMPNPAQGWDVASNTHNLVQGFLGGGQTALQWLQMLVLTEGGTSALWVSKNGLPRFDSRHSIITDTRQHTSQVTFNDNGSNVPFSIYNFSRDYVSGYLYNNVVVTPDNGVGNPQTFTDAGGILTYGEQDYSQGGIFNSDADAYAQAYYLVGHNEAPHSSPAVLTLVPPKSNTILDAAVQRELRDRATIKFKPPGSSTQKTYNVYIERIEHRFSSATNDWQCTFGFSSAEMLGDDPTSFFTTYDTGYLYDNNQFYNW